MSEENYQNKKISDLFEKDFFKLLKEFIFQKDFTSYLNCYLLINNTTIDDIKYTLNDPNYQKSLPDYENINIVSFDDFLKYMENDSCYAFEIHMHILKILYNLNLLNEAKVKNNYYQITLFPQKIVNDFYDSEILNKLLNSTINSLYSDYIDQNKFVVFPKTNSINIAKNNIFIFILDYLAEYIDSIINEYYSDVELLFETYKYESKLKLNISPDNNNLSKDIKNKIEDLKLSKYKKSKGRKKREYLDINFPELYYVMKEAKDILDTYKKRIRDIISNNDSKVAKEKFESLIKDMSYIETNILSIYYDEYIANSSAETKLCIYKFIDREYSMGFFSEDKDAITSFDNMKKWFKRH